MSLLSWFDTRVTDEFANAIADDLAGRVPVSVEGGQKPVTPERLRNAHEAIVARASAFARDHKLNWYTKARLGNTFRWILLEKGYEKEFADAWTHNVLVAVSTPASRAKS